MLLLYTLLKRDTAVLSLAPLVPTKVAMTQFPDVKKAVNAAKKLWSPHTFVSIYLLYTVVGHSIFLPT